MAAVKMKRAQEMREKVRAKLLTLENELKELTDSASKVCKADVAATAALNSAKVENCDLNCKEGKSACQIEVYTITSGTFREVFWN